MLEQNEMHVNAWSLENQSEVAALPEDRFRLTRICKLRTWSMFFFKHIGSKSVSLTA